MKDLLLLSIEYSPTPTALAVFWANLLDLAKELTFTVVLELGWYLPAPGLSLYETVANDLDLGKENVIPVSFLS